MKFSQFRHILGELYEPLDARVVHPLSLYGVPEQLPRGTLETPLDGTETAVPLHEHRRGRRDVGGQPLAGAKIRCSDDVSGVR